MRKSILLVTSLVVLSSCSKQSDTKSQPDVIAECAGRLQAIINFPNGLQNRIRVEWRGGEILNECNHTEANQIITTRRGNTLTIDEGGFGYTASSPLSFKVSNCDTNQEVFSLIDYNFSNEPAKLCESFDLTFQAN